MKSNLKPHRSKHFSFMKNKFYFYIFSSFLFLGAVLSIVLFRFNLGIDFAGGAVLKIRFEQTPEKAKVEQEIKNIGISYFQVQPSEKEYFIRTQALSEEEHQTIKKALNNIGKFEELSFETVGPAVSADLKRKAAYGVMIASIGIILYLAYAFRSVPQGFNSWVFGISAVIALLHDSTIVAGAFSFLGHFNKSIVIDAYFITALLTVIGYSVHDSIVVFDRVRENLIKQEGDFEEIADLSVWQTLSRSIATSFTTLLVVLALYLLGGESIKNFTLALTIGIFIGTYSSIFLATPILVSWQARTRE